MYTDALQAILLIVGSFFITWFGLNKLGGWGELQAFVQQDVGQYALWRPLSDPDFPWLGILIASPIIGIWYWCTDQYIVQRTLTAKNLTTARRGAIFGGFLKVFPVIIFLVPGLIGAALHAKGIIAIPLDKNGVIIGDQVFPTMVVEMLPLGLRGLVVGSLMAALMSSLSSLFNSSASLFTVDIYQKLRPLATQRQLVNVGRIATVVVVGLGLLWIPIMPLIADGGLYQYLQSVQGYLAPPITAVFLLGLFYNRTNANGAVAGLGLGTLLGLVKLTTQAIYGSAEGKISEPAALAYIGDYPFLYASGWLFAISVVVILVVSHLTAPPDPEKIIGLTYASIDKEDVRKSWNMWDVIATVFVAALVIGLYLYFSFWV